MIIASLLATVVGAVVLTDDLRRQHTRALRDAIQRSGSTMLRAAQEAEIDQSQFTRQVDMLEGTHKRLAMQPVAFWQWYALALFAAFGPPDELCHVVRLRRMAKMTTMSPRKARAS